MARQRSTQTKASFPSPPATHTWQVPPETEEEAVALLAALRKQLEQYRDS